MKQPDRVRLKDAEAWFEVAEKDFDVCVELRKTKRFWANCVFHAQQCTEKAMKGFLAWRDIPIQKTHDIERLSVSCITAEPKLRAKLSGNDFLTRYAVSIRYPAGPARDPAAREVDRAIRSARRVVEATKALVAAESTAALETARPKGARRKK